MILVWAPLLVLVGGLVFLSGFFAGTRLVSVVLLRQERRLARERQAVNDVWQRLQLRYGVDRDECVSDFLDRQQPFSM